LATFNIGWLTLGRAVRSIALFSGLLLTSIAVLAAPASAQNLIVNGDFAVNGGDSSFDSAPPWLVQNFGYQICTASGNCNGNSNVGAPAGASAYTFVTPFGSGGLSQTINLARSGSYLFSFEHTSNSSTVPGPGSILNVTVGGQTVFSGADTATSWTLVTAKLALNAGATSVFVTDQYNGGAEDFVDLFSLVFQPFVSLLPKSAPANAVNVAAGIDNFTSNGGPLPGSFANLVNLSGPPLVNALLQIDGETATAAQQTTFDAMGQFMGLLTDPFMSRTGTASLAPGAIGYADEAMGYAGVRNANAMYTKAPAMFTKAAPAVFVPSWNVWAAGYGGSQTTDGNAAVGSNNTTSSVAGTAVGADYLISPNTVAGFALAGGGTNFSVNNLGSGRSDLFQAGAYFRHTSGAAYITGALAYGWQDITTNRTVAVAGTDLLHAEFNANAWSGRLEGGYRLTSPIISGVGITPYAAAQFVTFDLPSYAENAIAGSNTFALTYGAKDVTDPRSELGIRTDKSWLLTDGLLVFRTRFAWAHDYDPNRSIAATFQTLPGSSFVVNGAAQASDSALTTASIEMKWRNGWSLAGTFEGEFSDVTSSYAGKGVVRYQW
jgi:uncharacterized protein with beta-barrel porin domain